MNNLRRIKSATALEGDEEQLDIEEVQRKDSIGKLSTTTTCTSPTLTSIKAKPKTKVGRLWHMERIAKVLVKIQHLLHLPPGKVHPLHFLLQRLDSRLLLERGELKPPFRARPRLLIRVLQQV